MSEMETNPLFDLGGRSVIVTGGGTGIGKVYSTALAGAGAQAIYQAGLLLAAENEEDEHHVFALKYKLFESGRWPIGVVGNSFHIF